MGHRLKNMQSAWDKIPPVDDAVASSTYVDKVTPTTPLIDDILLEELQSSIKNIDQDKYDKTMSQWQGVNPGKKDAIKSGRLYPHMLEMDDKELETALINRDYKQQ